MACYVFNFNLHDLNLVEIGKQKCTPLYSFGPFIRNEYIFHYVISGKGFCSMGHDIQESSVQKPDQPSGGPTAHEVRAGEGFLIEPHTKHIYNADLNDRSLALYLGCFQRCLRSTSSSGLRTFQNKYCLSSQRYYNSNISEYPPTSDEHSRASGCF